MSSVATISYLPASVSEADTCSEPSGSARSASQTERALLAQSLEKALDLDDPATFRAVLGSLALQSGVAHVAKSAGISRENLYRSIRVGRDLKLTTAMRILSAVGLRLSVTNAFRNDG